MKSVVHMTGKLTRDVTNVFSYKDGTALRALFTVACSSYYNGEDGTKKEIVDFIPCIAWGNDKVKILTTWGKRGRHLHVIGTLEAFQAGPDENGKYPPTRVQVRAEQFEFLAKKPEEVENPSKPPTAGKTLQTDMKTKEGSVIQKPLNITNTTKTQNDIKIMAKLIEQNLPK